ncbi:WecB/TagA/CpsF family glycosyltransferase [Pseudarthrobacter phenanthrenivorans]|uniref:WecB/TagA/CpsF family glycosyltransferase n=1 Tax=Pseudarthrobacter phenanthrenivorans TaxID=361575 RepID=UPI001128E8B9|nr:WecB/TagA/CpsF family glycosyltransferase [Pseudarthrobacter phenanthrenivorans]TPV49820.1 WecB/TagA/CpsF family glycosyltransferase [Pseudarthrobacter phenanthrenivorans]
MTLAGSLRSIVQPAALLRAARQRHALTRKTTLPPQHNVGDWVTVGGVPVKLLEYDEALKAIVDRAKCGGRLPLAVASANLDHVKHFGQGGRWSGTLDHQAFVEWLTLLDGAPLVTQAQKLTHRPWPRLAGSDLIWPLLDVAEMAGLRVGFVGGTAEVHALIQDKFAATHPGIAIAGWWAPERSSLADPVASRTLAAEISDARADLLVVCLGKPRQELWISEYGHLTGAKVMLAFGAVVDFLAGRVRRAPTRIRDLGLEWAWRLAMEPRRLARRYLVDGPEAYLKLRRASEGKVSPVFTPRVPAPAPPPALARFQEFTPPHEHADVAVLIVTYNSENDLPVLLQTLREETRDQSIKVIVADNSPTPSTLLLLKDHADIFAFSTGGNLGYSGGINAALMRAGTADAYLVLNPDIRVERGSVLAMRAKMATSGAGVVVPLLLDEDGSVYPSLRREPSVSRALGDALMGSRLPGRPGWLSEMDFDGESYLHSHKVEWATGAALLIRPDIVDLVGAWDEDYFLYSEETDFLRRVREAGASVWFEPRARMRHCRGGSGSSPDLDALMAINRIRYIRKFHTKGYAQAFRAAVALSALLRSPLQRRQKTTLAAVRREECWDQLPHAIRYIESGVRRDSFPAGAVIIPAHNEAAVIGRALEALAIPISSGSVEVVVACNGCTDGTEAVARSYPGVQVIEVQQASKVAALNAADRVATRWPRVYLDADIELPLVALRSTLERLANDETVLCARPAFRYDTNGASWTVRAYYRARNRLPQSSQSIWGAGVYGLNLRGHARLGEFPGVIGDDIYIDRLYEIGEKMILECPPVTVRTPRSAEALLATLRRVYRGNAELRGVAGSHTSRTFRELVSSIHGPAAALDAAVYASFAILGRVHRSAVGRWERDESSRAC